MKQLFLALFSLVALNSSAQTTLIPDANFELRLIDLGYDTVFDGSVLTANISGILSLDVVNLNISDLSGIEDFTALTRLICWTNQITSLDLSQNPALTYVNCNFNQLSFLNVSQSTSLDTLICFANDLTSIDVSQNTALAFLDCRSNNLTSLDISQNVDLISMGCGTNPLTSLDVSQNINLSFLTCMNCQLTSLNVTGADALTDLFCTANQLITLDLSQNTALTYLSCSGNFLWCLNVQNSSNQNILSGDFKASNNPNLTCIEVDDVAYSTSNWTNIDPTTSFSTFCSNSCSTGIEEMNGTTKQLLKIVDLMGRETTFKTNTVLVYMFSDGTTQRVYEVD